MDKDIIFDENISPLYAVWENNVICKLLMEYINDNNIILQLNEKTNDVNYPLLTAVMKNNLKVVQFILEHAKKHNIILKINEKNKNGDYPLLFATDKITMIW